MNTEQNEMNEPEQLELPFPDPETRRLAAENVELKKEIRMREAAYEIEKELTRAGARSPGLLVNDAKGRFQFDDDGKLINREAVVDHLRRTYPEQFGRNVPAGSIDASAGRNSRPPITKEALAGMGPDEIRKLDWEAVREALRSK